MTSSISRRRLVGGAMAATAAAAVTAPAVIAQTTPVRLNFAFAPDESGAIQALIDGFNAEQDGRIEASWIEAPVQSDAFSASWNRSSSLAPPTSTCSAPT